MGQQVAVCSNVCKTEKASSAVVFFGELRKAEKSSDAALFFSEGAPGHNIDVEVCICGRRFARDGQFCNKCGRKRPESAEFPPDVRLTAWLRRRNGPDCNFRDVFVELFGSAEGVGPRRFIEVLEAYGYQDGKAAFAVIDKHAKNGVVTALDLEYLQMDIEAREAEGLKDLRAFLKENFSNPAAVFKEMGKGEGDALNETEFADSMRRLGFKDADPLRLFHFLDKDLSGEVCFSEFKSIMRAVGVASRYTPMSRRTSNDRNRLSSKERSRLRRRDNDANAMSLREHTQRKAEKGHFGRKSSVQLDWQSSMQPRRRNSVEPKRQTTMQPTRQSSMPPSQPKRASSTV